MTAARFRRQMPRALWLIAPAVIASVACLAGCEREQRQLYTPPPAASAASAVTMSSIQPVASAVTTSSTQPVAAAVSATVSNPYENNAYAVSQGKRLFRAYNCSGCHAQGSGDSGPALMDDKWIYGADPASVFTTIKQGRPNGMPAFGGHVSDDQIWQIVAYVRSMSGQLRSDIEPPRSDSLQAGKPEQRRPPEEPKRSSAPPAAEH
ncbi:c-type cytochrome [Paraburkholderia sp. SIMBA_055]